VQDVLFLRVFHGRRNAANTHRLGNINDNCYSNIQRRRKQQQCHGTLNSYSYAPLRSTKPHQLLYSRARRNAKIGGTSPRPLPDAAARRDFRNSEVHSYSTALRAMRLAVGAIVVLPAGTAREKKPNRFLSS